MTVKIFNTYDLDQDVNMQQKLDALISEGYSVAAVIPGYLSEADIYESPSLILHKPGPVSNEKVSTRELPKVEADDEPVTFADVVRSGDFVVLDTETTGLHDGEICEISIIASTGRVLLDTLVKTSQPIPPDAQRIHGISDEMVQHAPTWAKIGPQVRKLLMGQNVIIYNAVYDRKMMHKSDERAGLDRVDYKAEAVYWCAMEAYAEHWGEWNDYHGNYRWQKLTNAAAQQGVQIVNAHRAKGDCLMTLGVIRAIAGID